MDGCSPVDRGKQGMKRSSMTEGYGIPHLGCVPQDSLSLLTGWLVGLYGVPGVRQHLAELVLSKQLVRLQVLKGAGASDRDAQRSGADRVGTSITSVPVLFGASGRPNGSAGAYMYWRVAGDVTDQVAATGAKVLRK